VVSAPAPQAPAAPALDPAADGYGPGNAETINAATWDGQLLAPGAEQPAPDWIVGEPGSFPTPGAEQPAPDWIVGEPGSFPTPVPVYDNRCGGDNPPLQCLPQN
jgi:hypothetical protein